VFKQNSPKDKNYFNQNLDMENKIRKKIELSASGKEKLARMFNVTHRSVCYALDFKRNSVQAAKIREAALINGGKLVEIIDVTDSVKRTVKVLDSHGNVKAVINDTVTL
jgi:hypothetical protein